MNEDVGRGNILFEIPCRGVVVVGSVVISGVFSPNVSLKIREGASKQGRSASPEILVGNTVIIAPAELILAKEALQRHT